MIVTGQDGIDFSRRAKRLALRWRIAIHMSASGSRDKEPERSVGWFRSEENAEEISHS
jgi:hypothetical protein